MGLWDRDGTAMLRPASHGGVAQSLSRAERKNVPGNSGDRVAIDGARHALRPVPRSRLHGQAHHRAGARRRPRARNARPSGGPSARSDPGPLSGRAQGGAGAGEIGIIPEGRDVSRSAPSPGQDRTATSSAPRKTSPGQPTITGQASRAIADSASGTEREHFCCAAPLYRIEPHCRTGGAALHDVTPFHPGRCSCCRLHRIRSVGATQRPRRGAPCL